MERSYTRKIPVVMIRLRYRMSLSGKVTGCGWIMDARTSTEKNVRVALNIYTARNVNINTR